MKHICDNDTSGLQEICNPVNLNDGARPMWAV